MENSKLPFQYWFIAMHLMTCTKKSFSSKEIQRELGHNRYQPIWEMAHKIRSVMGFEARLFTPIVEQNITRNTVINSDGSTSYSELKNNFDHRPKTIPKEEGAKILPWVHTAISNAKRMLLDVHHRIDDDFLQNYLNAFVFKINRRYFKNIFDRVLKAAVTYRWNYLGETYG
jgi:hypothetical protein